MKDVWQESPDSHRIVEKGVKNSFPSAINGNTMAYLHQPILPNEEILAIRTIVRAVTGQDLGAYSSESVADSIRRRMAANGIDNGEGYLVLLVKSPVEAQFLCREFKISAKVLFEDNESFDVLRYKIIPELLSDSGKQKSIRIWNACCATGEEAYTMAILLQEHLDAQNEKAKVQIFATDHDEAAINQAKSGLFTDEAVAGLEEKLLKAHFTRTHDRWKVTKRLREKIIFAFHRILRDPPFSKLDIIICRNFLLYLNLEMQRWLLTLFHSLLNPQGILFLGPTEAPESDNPLFKPIDSMGHLYRRRNITRNSDISAPIPYALWSIWANQRPPHFERRSTNWESHYLVKAERYLLDRYAPPSVVINEHNEVQHFLSNVRNYLQLPDGEPTMDLLKIARRELRPVLRTSITQAFTEQKPVTIRKVIVQVDGRKTEVNVLVVPIENGDAHEKLALVILEPRQYEQLETFSLNTKASVNETSNEDFMIQQLEEQFRATQEQLQTAIEQLESSKEEYMTANEELMSINEEFQVANEELQSTNEELESSRREQMLLNREVASTNEKLHKKVEELDRMHKDMENLFASSGIATIFLDQQLKVKRYSPAMAEVLGLTTADIDRPFARLSHAGYLSNLTQDALEVMKNRLAQEHEIALKGDDRIFIMRIFPYITSDNTVDGVVVTLIEVTKLKRAQQALMKGNRELEITNRELESFIYSISHDLRGPLRTIIGFSEILGIMYKDKLDATGRDYLRRIDKGASSMVQLIDDLFRLSVTSRQELNLQQTDLSAIAVTILSEFKNEQPQRDVHFEVEQGLQALVDPDLMQVMLTNLLLNAWKFTSKKKSARIMFNCFEQDGQFVYRVSDNGAGFSPAYADKMFWPFHRLHTAEEFEGTGIGLAIVERIVQRHGGRIWAEGEVDKGATFYFTLE